MNSINKIPSLKAENQMMDPYNQLYSIWKEIKEDESQKEKFLTNFKTKV